jgi:hypothetical protein
MIRKLSVMFAMACLCAGGPAIAGENHNEEIGSSNRELARSEFQTRKASLEIYAADRVDTARLLENIGLSDSSTPQEISDRVNAVRKRFYPDEEIILSITPWASRSVSPENKVGLVRAIYWWNNNNCSTCNWYAQYTSTTATMFIDDVRSGAYRLFDRTGSGNWVFRYRVRTGESATRYSYGPLTLRGFKGDADGVASKADIVMYFFN